MEGKRNRAIWFAMMFMLSSTFMGFALNRALTSEASLMDVFLPVLLMNMALWFLMAVVLLVQYVVLRKAPEDSRKEQNSSIVMGILMVISWSASAIQLASHKLLSSRELAMVLVLVVILGIYVAGMQVKFRFAGDKKKSVLLGRKMVTTITLLAIVAFSWFQAKLYQNELLSPRRVILMTALNALVLFLAVWLGKLPNRIIGVALLLVQAGVSIYEFLLLNKSPDVLQAMGPFLKGYMPNAGEITPSRIVFWFMIAFVIMLALAVALQFTGQLMMIGKMASVTFTILIVCIVGTVSLIQSSADGTLDVDKNEAIAKVNFYVYVAKDATYKTPADLSNQKVGMSLEEVKQELTDAQNLLLKDCPEVRLEEFENTSRLLEAYLNGELEGILCSRDTLENMTIELEETIDENRVFEEEVKEIGHYEVAFAKGNDEPTPVTGDDPADTDAPIWTDEPADTDVPAIDDITTQPFIIYFSGIDTYGPITSKSRSDVNVLVAVNPVTKEIALVSTPRDAYVYIAGHSTTQKDKLTHAGNYGIDCSEKTLERLYGIKINRYIRINFTSVETIVDLLGGVDVVSLETFTSRWGYKYVKGWNHVNGKEALVFARERKTVAGGDTVRGKHHIELLKGVINKITTTAVLTKYQSLLEKASQNFQTDLTTAEIAALVAMQLSDGAEWHFSSYAACGVGTMDWCAAYSGSKLYVNNLHDWSVQKGAELLTRVLNGEYIKDGEYEYDK